MTPADHADAIAAWAVRQRPNVRWAAARLASVLREPVVSEGEIGARGALLAAFLEAGT